MDDDRSWLKNPILPRPPAVPRFSAAELRAIDGEYPSSVMRVAPRTRKAPTTQRRQHAGGVVELELELEAPESRRTA